MLILESPTAASLNIYSGQDGLPEIILRVETNNEKNKITQK